jgi:hypothetical protein
VNKSGGLFHNLVDPKIESPRVDVYFCPVDQHFRVILLVNSARTVFGDKLHFGLSWAKCHIVVRL